MNSIDYYSPPLLPYVSQHLSVSAFQLEFKKGFLFSLNGIIQSCIKRGSGLMLGKHFLLRDSVKHWASLPREVIDSSGISVFKRNLDKVLNMSHPLVSSELV